MTEPLDKFFERNLRFVLNKREFKKALSYLKILKKSIDDGYICSESYGFLKRILSQNNIELWRLTSSFVFRHNNSTMATLELPKWGEK